MSIGTFLTPEKCKRYSVTNVPLCRLIFIGIINQAYDIEKLPDLVKKYSCFDTDIVGLNV